MRVTNFHMVMSTGSEVGRLGHQRTPPAHKTVTDFFAGVVSLQPAPLQAVAPTV